MTDDRLHIDWGNDKLHRTQRQVEKNPYDLEAWSILLREAQTKHISEVRPLYEHLISIFPSASRYWRIYIEHEMKTRNFEKVEKVGVRYGHFQTNLWSAFMSITNKNGDLTLNCYFCKTLSKCVQSPGGSLS